MIQKLIALLDSSSAVNIPSVPQFQRALDRERSRADRNGSVMCLIKVDLTQANVSESKAIYEAAGFLRGRLRITDDFGMLSRKSVGIVLPETNRAGAWVVADSTSSTLSPRIGKISFEIFEYPNSDLPDDSEPVSHDESHHAAGSMTHFFMRATPTWKRALDIFASGIGLILLSPMFLVVGLAIKLSSPGPIFFCQQRTGAGNKPFTMYKFRSMVPAAESMRDNVAHLNERDGPAFKIKNDPRVTPIGSFIRKTNLDEFPQLLNVFKGDMSLVGPRPLPCAESDACRGWHRRRLDVVPGMTCIWQTSNREGLTFEQWVRMDIAYAKSVSLLHDLWILFKTPIVFLRGDQ